MQEPYLNWAGKVEQTSVEVLTVSLHTHEKIDSRAIIEKVRKTDVVVAKNYLNMKELKTLNNLVEQYLLFAEG